MVIILQYKIQHGICQANVNDLIETHPANVKKNLQFYAGHVANNNYMIQSPIKLKNFF